MTGKAPTPPDNADIVFDAARLLCSERGIDIARCESGKPGVLAAKLEGSTREWVLLVDCQEECLALPAVGLRPPRGLLPHVSYHGSVCVNDEQGLSIADQLTHDFLDGVRAALLPHQLALWNELLGPSKNARKTNALLLSVPRQAGGRSLIGVAFAAHDREIDRRVSVFPLTARRRTASHMRERGGAPLELMAKRVAILGCGAVGSVVADTLAAAGVGKLTLIDAEEYSEDNVFRHVLQPAYIGFPKTIALKHQLEQRYPGLAVEAFNVSAQRWLASTPLNGIDGVVVAFGAPSVERSFGRAFRSQEHELPLVFTWLEALDLGGHSVLMWAQRPGCLDCLYRDDEGASCLHPRTSFLEPNQHVTRNLTGCAGVFVPYGALQARKTGHMAAEQMLGALVGSFPERAYRYWVGDGTQARAQGLRTTPWWSRAPTTSAAVATEQAFGRPCKRCRGDS